MRVTENKKRISVIILLIAVSSLYVGVVVYKYGNMAASRKIESLNSEIRFLKDVDSADKDTTPNLENINSESCVSNSDESDTELELINTMEPIPPYINEIKAWNSYVNNEFKFEISYPSSFLLREYDKIQQKETGAIARILAFDGESKDLTGRDNPGYFPYALISYWDDINNEYITDSSLAEERKFEKIEDLFVDTLITKDREIVIDGKKAYEVTIAGAGLSPGIMIEHNNAIYRIEFSDRQNQLNEAIKEKIISSLKFLD